jgi:hypothetical protein
MRVQVTIDCRDPHALARFYADAFGYEVGDSDTMVRQLLQSGALTDDDVIDLDGKLAFREGAFCMDPAGVMPRLFLQLVPEQKVAKNRVHLDYQVGPARRDETVARLIELGATRLWDGRQGPFHTWVTIADPEGNELCIS